MTQIAQMAKLVLRLICVTVADGASADGIRTLWP